jgi:N-ethylmaleimide reductase
MTRCCAGEGNVPGPLTVTSYTQRATAGLIVLEGYQVSPQGVGFSRIPGIHSAEQVAGWKKVTAAVHQAGGRIFLQLWHVGRMSHPDYLGGELPVAPSAVPVGEEMHTPLGKKMIPTPRALTESEITGVVLQFGLAAKHAKEAGFDGVEIHGANGYLLDQFQRDGSNRRTDAYGGSRESGNEVIESGLADLVSFGVPYLANPDLPERFERNAPLNQEDISTFYAGEEKGYTDSPALS